MRQAGRSLPEYRELRKQYGLFEVCRQPELCAEVTLQPVLAHGVDAAATFAAYVAGCARAGADAIQLFDSWVGALSVADYREFAAPYSAQVLDAVDVPTIHFATGDAHLLEERAEAGGDVIGVDWRVPLDVAWERVGFDRGIQGNLDGALLLGPWERATAGAKDVLARAGGRPGHIFNLGHGVLPESDPADLRRLVELVHERTLVAA